MVYYFLNTGQCISIQPAPLLPICATVLCAFPDCLNPIPPGHGQCCPTCPPAGIFGELLAAFERGFACNTKLQICVV